MIDPKDSVIPAGWSDGPEAASLSSDGTQSRKGFTRHIGTAKLVVAALIGLGVLLRLIQYTYNRSLWLDEAMLALNVSERSFAQLLDPLADLQSAPPLFLWATKASTLLLGTSEYALRLLPLLAGMAALPLLYAAATRAGKATAVLALALVALSSHLIWYSAELKPYSVDLAVTLLVMLVVLRVCEHDALDSREAAVLAALGALALWFSNPCVFVLGGIGLALGLRFLLARDWRSLKYLTLVAGIWMASFGLAYLIVIREIDREPFQAFWQSGFLPLPPNNLGALLEWARKPAAALSNPLGLNLVYAGAVLLVLGSVTLIRRSPDLFMILILPVVLTLLAAGLELYPFARRLILFIVPSLAILVAHGMGSMWERTRSPGPRLLVLALAGIMLWGPAKAAMSVPMVREELRPVVGFLEARYRDGDAIYVYYGAVPAFRYYTRHGELTGAEIYHGVGEVATERPDFVVYRADLDRFRGKERVWIVFSHVYGTGAENEEVLFLNHLDAIGVRQDSVRRTGAAAFLYDLRLREATDGPGAGTP